MSEPIVIRQAPLGFPWATLDPFLFCVHHLDHYPPGNAEMGPNASLAGRNIGMDFEIRDGWRMYHGDTVPGFPRHPHRGFETLTLARRGFIDHSDSMGARARFGHGDAQWMTAGRGVVHSEMFPLVRRDDGNTTELFQIWINLPARNKMAEPHFAMLWSENIPVHDVGEKPGQVEVVTVAGALDGVSPPSPPPHSWAAQEESALAVWTIRMQPGATWSIPAGPEGAVRALYVFEGESMTIGHTPVTPGNVVQVRDNVDTPMRNGERPAEILMLQGRPIGEPVARHGPFVMNTGDEIRQAMRDYQATGFGGWPWERNDPVHSRHEGRFAQFGDGSVERPGQARKAL